MGSHSSLPSVVRFAESLTGKLLIASPVMVGTPFAGAVIYICAHSDEGGAMGFVINHHLPKKVVDDLLEQLQIAQMSSVHRVLVSAGGPVDITRGFILHSGEWQSEDGLSVTPDVTLSASISVLKEMAEGHGPRQALLAMGHASWVPGQLEEEVLLQNSWLIAPFSRDILFGKDFEQKWRQALASINFDPSQLTGQTGRA